MFPLLSHLKTYKLPTSSQPPWFNSRKASSAEIIAWFFFLEPQQNNQPQPQFSELFGEKESRKGINNECGMVGPSKFGKHPAFDILVVVVVVMVFPAGLVVEEISGYCFAAVAVVRVCIWSRAEESCIRSKGRTVEGWWWWYAVALRRLNVPFFLVSLDLLFGSFCVVFDPCFVDCSYYVNENWGIARTKSFIVLNFLLVSSGMIFCSMSTKDSIWALPLPPPGRWWCVHKSHTGKKKKNVGWDAVRLCKFTRSVPLSGPLRLGREMLTPYPGWRSHNAP